MKIFYWTPQIFLLLIPPIVVSSNVTRVFYSTAEIQPGIALSIATWPSSSCTELSMDFNETLQTYAAYRWSCAGNDDLPIRIGCDDVHCTVCSGTSTVVGSAKTGFSGFFQYFCHSVVTSLELPSVQVLQWSSSVINVSCVRNDPAMTIQQALGYCVPAQSDFSRVDCCGGSMVSRRGCTDPLCSNCSHISGTLDGDQPTCNGLSIVTPLTSDPQCSPVVVTSTPLGIIQQPCVSFVGWKGDPSFALSIANDIDASALETLDFVVSANVYDYATGNAVQLAAGQTTQTAACGLVKFTDLTFTTAGQYLINFTTSSLFANGRTVAVASAPFQVIHGAADHLNLTQSPAGFRTGKAFKQQPVVTVLDAGGNTVADGGAPAVWVQCEPGATCVLTHNGRAAPAVSQPAPAGRAEFSALGVQLDIVAAALRFSAAGLPAVLSGTFRVTARPYGLAITVQPPPTAQAGVAFCIEAALQAQDDSIFGWYDTAPAVVNATLYKLLYTSSFLVQPGFNSAAASAAVGVVTAAARLCGVSATQLCAKCYVTLSAAMSFDGAALLFPVVKTDYFAVGPGPPTALVVAAAAPAAAALALSTFTVAANDAYGNRAVSYAGVIRADLVPARPCGAGTAAAAGGICYDGASSSPAAAVQTVWSNATAGAAGFTLQVSQAGSYRVLFSTIAAAVGGGGGGGVGDGALRGAAAGPFEVTAGPPRRLLVVQEPDGVTAGLVFRVAAQVEVLDAADNRVNLTGPAVQASLDPGNATAPPAWHALCAAAAAPAAAAADAGPYTTTAATASSTAGASCGWVPIAAGAILTTPAADLGDVHRLFDLRANERRSAAAAPPAAAGSEEYTLWYSSDNRSWASERLQPTLTTYSNNWTLIQADLSLLTARYLYISRHDPAAASSPTAAAAAARPTLMTAAVLAGRVPSLYGDTKPRLNGGVATLDGVYIWDRLGPDGSSYYFDAATYYARGGGAGGGTAAAVRLRFTYAALPAVTSRAVSLAGRPVRIQALSSPAATAAAGVGGGEVVGPWVEVRDVYGTVVTFECVNVTAQLVRNPGAALVDLSPSLSAMVNMSAGGSSGGGVAGGVNNGLSVSTSVSGSSSGVDNSGGGGTYGEASRVGAGTDGAYIWVHMVSTCQADPRPVFTSLPVGVYTMTLSSGELLPVTLSNLTVGLGPPRGLCVRRQPAGAGAGAPLDVQPLVALCDAGNNTVTAEDGGTGAGAAVQAVAYLGPGGQVCTHISCVLFGQETVQTQYGIARFRSLRVDLAGAGYFFRFFWTRDDGNLTSVDSDRFQVIAERAQSMVIESMPAGCASGVPCRVQPLVAATDGGGGNIVPLEGCARVTALVFSLQLGLAAASKTQAGANASNTASTSQLTTSSLTTFTAQFVSSDTSSGAAAFQDFGQGLPDGLYAASFTCGTLLPQLISPPFAVGARAAALRLVTQPRSRLAGEALPAQPAVAVRDQGDRLLDVSWGYVNVSALDGTSQLRRKQLVGNQQAALQHGIAEFTNLGILTAATCVKLVFTYRDDHDGPVLSVTSWALDVQAGAPHAIRILQGLTTGALQRAGSPFDVQPVVALLDSAGNILVGESNAAITAVLLDYTDRLLGQRVIVVSSGVANYTDLAIAVAVGCLRIQFERFGIIPAATASISVAPAQPASLNVLTSPSGARAGFALSSQPTVSLQDEFGNTCDYDSQMTGSGVAAYVSTNTSNGTQPLLQGNTVSSIKQGIASWTDLRVDKMSGPLSSWVLSFRWTTLIAYSDPFLVTTGPPQALSITTAQPFHAALGELFREPPIVQIVDLGGNPVALRTVVISVSLQGNTASLLRLNNSGLSLSTNQAGYANFSDFYLNSTSPARGIVMFFSSAAISIDVNAIPDAVITVQSLPFDLCGKPTALVIVQQPASTWIAGVPPMQPHLDLVDQAGISAAWYFPLCPIICSAENATRVFNPLGNTVITLPGQFTDLRIEIASAQLHALTFKACQLRVRSANFTVRAAAPNVSVILNQPSAPLSAGLVLSVQPTLAFLDAFGNGIDGSACWASTATLLFGGVANPLYRLDGNTNVTVVNGTARFTDLRVRRNGTNYTIQFKTMCSTATLMSVSGPFSVSIGKNLSQLLLVVVPQGFQAGQYIVVQPQVAVADYGGNIMSFQRGFITATLWSQGGTSVSLAGNTVIALSSGTSAFTDLIIYFSPESQVINVTWITGLKLEFTFSQTGSQSETSSNIEVWSPAFNLSQASGFQSLIVNLPSTAFYGGGILWATQPAVSLIDSIGYLCSAVSGIQVTAAVVSQQPCCGQKDASALAPAVLIGTTVVTASFGLALFTDLLIATSASYVLSFSAIRADDIAVSANTAAITVYVSNASQLLLAAAPSTAKPGIAWALQPSLVIADAGNNRVSNQMEFGSSVPVTATLLQQPCKIMPFCCTGGTWDSCVYRYAAALGVLTGHSVVTASLGAAIFTDLAIITTGQFTPVFSFQGFAWAVGPNINVTEGEAARLQLLVDLAQSQVFAGSPFTVPVALLDAGGNVAALAQGWRVSATFLSQSGQSNTTFALQDSVSALVSKGMATLADVDITVAGSCYQLNISARRTGPSSALPSLISDYFSVLPGSEAEILLIEQPESCGAGLPLCSQPQISIADAFGNLLLSTLITYAISVQIEQQAGAVTMNAMLSGSVTQSTQNAQAAFTDLVISPAGVFTLTFVSVRGGLTAAVSEPFSVTVGAASHLWIQQQPSGASPGRLLSTQPIVWTLDEGGNHVTPKRFLVYMTLCQLGVEISIALSLPRNGSATRQCLVLQTGLICTDAPAQANGTDGVATPSQLQVDVAASDFSILFSSPHLVSVMSTSFSVTIGAPSRLEFLQLPAGVIAGEEFVTQPSIMVCDAGRNRVPGVTWDARLDSPSPRPWTLIRVQLLIPLQQINGSSGLQFACNTSSTLTSDNDQNIRLMSLSGGLGLTARITNGLATFSSLSVSQPGRFTLLFRPYSNNSTESSCANVNARSPPSSLVSPTIVSTLLPSALRIVTQPTTAAMRGLGSQTRCGGRAQLDTVALQVVDNLGATVNAESSLIVTAQLQPHDTDGAPWAQSLSGAITARATSGVVLFTDLAIDAPFGAHLLTFSASNLPPIASQPFAVLGPTRLALVQPPAQAVSGALFGRQPVLSLLDELNQTAAYIPPGLSVHVRIAAGTGSWSGVLVGNTAAAAWTADGRAGFTDLGIVGAYGGYVLVFEAAANSECVTWPIVSAATVPFDVLIQ